MGQFLAIGLVTKIEVEKAKVQQAQMSVGQLQEKIQQKYGFNADLYELIENEEVYEFELKKEILFEQLLPFLKTIYPLLYDESTYYDSILEKLGSIPSSQWMEFVQNESEEAFQFDKYGKCDYLRENFVDLKIYYESLILSMEGKIVMETYGRQFRFFKQLMTQTFKEFSLANALRVYITG
jgi:hypothetical protein